MEVLGIAVRVDDSLVRRAIRSAPERDLLSIRSEGVAAE
jgi:hypothetical protein